MGITVPSEPIRVVAAAHRIRLTPEDTGDPRAVPVIISAPPPARHHNLFAIQPDGPYPTGGDSGFLLSDGSFATREEAARIAVDAGQVRPNDMHVIGSLYSEDLW
ncbi:hypothetical protein [Brevundimonas sanguinis]|uniref:hypothetical protein n=1 Tax=Brevundimonas sanguinis TaxID=3021811 RepID=UPI0024152045|nr:hypothetical protein [Brevundimonas sp. NCCP 15609]